MTEHDRPWGRLVLVGLVGGLLSGMFGVGGGIVMVPLLVTVARMDQRRAAATSLAAILPTAVVGATQYLVRGEADLAVAAVVAVAAVGGSWLGTWLLRRLPVAVLRWGFVALLVVVAVRMATTVASRGVEVDWDAGTVGALLGVGAVMGVTAGLFGVGGGIVLVPALVLLLGMSDLLAKGTSLLAMVPAALTGSLANRRSRLLDLRVAAVLGLVAAAASVLGVQLAFWVPAEVAGPLFAVLVVVAAVQLAVRAWRARGDGGRATSM